MKRILFSILGAFMVSTMASAQYVNVKLDDGTWRSFKTSTKTEVNFGAKAGLEPTESTQTVTVNGHTVAVKLADDTPASDVVLNAYVEEGRVNIKAISALNKELMCTWDGNEEIPDPDVSNGFYTFVISDISKDVVATVRYRPIYTVKFDMKGRGEAIQDANIAYRKALAAPSFSRVPNSVFWCWCTDAECTIPYDFSKDVTADMTLYAKWTDGINNHAYTELAGYKWATENVGASYVVKAVADPETPGNTYGLYYYKQDDDEAKIAAESWGQEKDANNVVHAWNLPNKEQWQALMDECYWEWTSSYNYLNSPYNGMPGCIVYQAKTDEDKGQFKKGYNGYSPTADTHIFLPAVGKLGGGYEPGFIGLSLYAYYWASEYETSIFFYYGAEKFIRGDASNRGLPVRPVSE